MTSSSTGCPEHRVAVPGRRLERLEALAELTGEELVDRGEHLGPRAVVQGQRQHLRRRVAPVAKHLDVGVPEAVDRLELVADEEQLLRGPGAQEIDEVRLEAVRVLELVDHDRAEAELLDLPDRLVALEEVACLELEILEVEGRLPILGGGVRGTEPGQQLLEEIAVARRELLEGERRTAALRVVERGRPRAAGCGRGGARAGARAGASSASRSRTSRAALRWRSVAFASAASASASATSSTIAASRFPGSPCSSTSSRPAERNVS